MYNPIKYQSITVFDCQGMPADIRKSYFKVSSHQGTTPGNDTFTEWYPDTLSWMEEYAETEGYKDEDGITGKELYNMALAVETWLQSHGKKPEDTVLIKHWW